MQTNKEAFLKACKDHFNNEPIYQKLKSFTINELLVLMTFLDSDLDYFITSSGKLGFVDLRGYYDAEFNFITETQSVEDFPIIDMGVKKLGDLLEPVYDKIVSTFMDIIDNYNSSHPKDQIKYQF